MRIFPRTTASGSRRRLGTVPPARGRVGPAVCQDRTTTGHQGARVLRLEPDYPLICTRTCGFHGILNPLWRVNLADEGVEVVCGHAHVATFGAGAPRFYGTERLPHCVFESAHPAHPTHPAHSSLF